MSSINNIIIIIIIALLPLTLLAETTFEVVEFREDPLNQKALVSPVKDLDANPCALLRIESDVAENLFVTDVKVYKTETVSAGIIEAYLSYRERNITLTAKGVMPLRYKIPQSLEKGKVYVLRVRTLGEGVRRVVESAEIRLSYKPAADEQVYGGLDGDVNFIDFASGMRILKPSPGVHTVRLNSKGRIWDKRYELVAGQKVEEPVEFTEAKVEKWDIGKPGALYIETTPAGATVFLNSVEQGITPLDLQSIQPGKYQIDLAKDLYLPEIRSVEVKSLSYERLAVPLTSNFGRVKIESDPSGAAVWINGQQRGSTPLEIPQINAGAYSVRLFQNLYYEANDNFEIKPGGEFIKKYALKPQFGSVKLTSVPSGAQVTVQGVLWGTTPLTRDLVPSGEHIAQLKLPNYFDADQMLRIGDGEEVTKEVILQPSVGWLTVTSDPSGATVINAETEQVLGTTPIKALTLDRGTYRLSIEKDLYEPYETATGLTYGGKQSVEAKLVRSVGHLQVSTNPQGAKIILNGKNYGETPSIVRDLPTGNYELRLEKDGYDINAERVAIARNDVVRYSAELGTAGTIEWKKKRHKAQMLALVVPTGGQFLSGQNVRGALYVGAFISSLALASSAASDHNDQTDLYDLAQANYRAANVQTDVDAAYSEMQFRLKKMDDAQDRFNLMIFAAAGVYALQLTDALIWGGGEKPVARSLGALPTVSPFASANSQRTMVGVTVCFR